MKTLVMDTSNNYLAIAFYKDDKLIDQCKIEALKKQSELAIPMMQKMLGSVSLKDIDEMIIAIGPGSYTGVRIALTISKTLALQLGGDIILDSTPNIKTVFSVKLKKMSY